MVERYYVVKKEDKYLLVLQNKKGVWIKDLCYARLYSMTESAMYQKEVHGGDSIVAVDKYSEDVVMEAKEMDDALERTLRGKIYSVKGKIVITFEEFVKAIDEDDAEELALKKLDAEDNVKVEIEEVIEEEQ